MGFPSGKSDRLHVRAGQCFLHLGCFLKASEHFSQALHSLADPGLRRLAIDGLAKCKVEQAGDLKVTWRCVRGDPSAEVYASGLTINSTRSTPLLSANTTSGTSVRLFDAGPAKGWTLETTRNVKPGEILLLDLPYASRLKGDCFLTHCYRCYRSGLCGSIDDCAFVSPELWRGNVHVRPRFSRDLIHVLPNSVFARTFDELHPQGLLGCRKGDTTVDRRSLRVPGFDCFSGYAVISSTQDFGVLEDADPVILVATVESILKQTGESDETKHLVRQQVGFCSEECALAAMQPPVSSKNRCGLGYHLYECGGLPCFLLDNYAGWSKLASATGLADTSVGGADMSHLAAACVADTPPALLISAICRVTVPLIFFFGIFN
ncbi:unnamed protein product [Schistocephalus solidus]|uniref:SET domain-containing protein n=1 Tax=Schistocephalus solidus TaxID=70667 RepID=A0A3P7D514_SCHSO|nr:unnamed protein product [Schistocephalus solidus]